MLVFDILILILYIYFTLQAILFYTPRWLWKSWEGGKIHALIMDLDIGICSEAEKKQKKKLLLDYLWENLRWVSPDILRAHHLWRESNVISV